MGYTLIYVFAAYTCSLFEIQLGTMKQFIYLRINASWNKYATVNTIARFFAIIFSSISFQILYVHKKNNNNKNPPAREFKFQIYQLPGGSETKVLLYTNAIMGKPFSHKLSLKGSQRSFSGFWNGLEAF